MQVAVLEQKLIRLQRARNALGLVLIIMIFSNLLLAWQVLNTRSQMILVPSRVSDGMIAQGGGDVRYLESLALDAVQAMYTLSPATSDYSRSVIDRVANPTERETLLRRFDEVAEDIRKREISTVFMPEKIDHDLANLTLLVTGQFATYLGTNKVGEERRAIRIVFAEFGGSVRIARIERIADAPTQPAGDTP